MFNPDQLRRMLLMQFLQQQLAATQFGTRPPVGDVVPRGIGRFGGGPRDIVPGMFDEGPGVRIVPPMPGIVPGMGVISPRPRPFPGGPGGRVGIPAPRGPIAM